MNDGGLFIHYDQILILYLTHEWTLSLRPIRSTDHLCYSLTLSTYDDHMKLLSVAKTIFLIVKLVVPTDFEILEAMSNGQRQTAPNLAEILDRRRQYMNDRLSNLSSIELVRKVGPSDRSGMYEITSRGLIALEFREDYEHEKASDFAKLVDAHQSRLESDYEESQEFVLNEIQKGVPQRLFEELADNCEYDIEHLEETLEELESVGLIQKQEFDSEYYYNITQVGELLMTSLDEDESRNFLISEKSMD